jgi:hypothetical protein
VDSDLASRERKALMELAAQLDGEMKKKGKRLLICGGHGTVSTIEGGKLITHGTIEKYPARSE